MDSCDVLIVGGGPAGSACAWGLRDAGLEVVILDREMFPRHKVCGGWVTPAVFAELEIDPAEYGRGRVIQPITSFRTASMGGRAIESDYGREVSYGILRSEFDDYLLRRSGARLRLGAKLASLERERDGWLVNGHIKARLVVGAGGYFCPVARLTGSRAKGENAVVAQEAEFEMDAAQMASCRVQPETPELYFCPDMKGYGWCFRKDNFLNVGLGRLDQHRLGEHVAEFVRFLKATGRIEFDIPSAMLGHAYLLYGPATRNVVDDGLLLAGDAAGLAYAQSGEGIRPAVESGLLAANTILAARGDYSRQALEPYRALLAGRMGASGQDWASTIGQRLPAGWIATLGKLLLGSLWFTRKVVIDRWFLHSDQPPLDIRPGGLASQMHVMTA